ncbi:MAG: flgB [Caloramator sp.]|jgi:flagellar basal-body rod protein FlgB|uniref:flagellar basal body rod protein FlgB n=1 Tax=Caloramator sp. TaxID=1871330 RepID=UPI001DDF6C13|nr:flagellar basal body rod protein FlgB [Caloramator sp.]MBZ4663099.1 flgB [Caloramator sp.]
MIKNIDNLSYYLIKKGLDATSERGRAISNNIANINTAGYKAKRVVFEENLKSALDGTSINLKTTNSRHINDGKSIENIKYEIIQDKSNSLRLDGNNVDIDLEMANLAANQILYNALVSQANSRIAMRRTVISGK